MGFKGIQIIGTQRSGSNLLRLMLNELDGVSAPHPPHILKNFYPLISKYNLTAEPSAFTTLVDDVCSFVELNPVPWNCSKFSRQDIYNSCNSHSLLELFRVIYESHAKHNKSAYWCCKSMSNVHFFEEIEGSDLKPFYIHIYRDGRDVAASFKKAIVGEKHIYLIAKQWQAEQELAFEIYDKIGSSRVYQIKYEDLISAPHKEMKEVAGFIGVDYSTQVLEYFNSKESLSTASSGEMWRNVSKPIMSENFNKFLTSLNVEDIEIFESVAGETLKRLGYKLVNDDYKNLQVNEHDILEYQRVNTAAKLEAKSKFQQDGEIRQKQDSHFSAVRKRLSL